MLAGRCANGSELDSGTRWHAVPLGEHGLSWSALCGAEPGRRSAGWSSWTVRGQAVTCPRCLGKLPAGFGWLGIDGWAGRSRTRVEIVGQTATRWRIKAIERTKLAGRNRWLEPGDVALVPKSAVTVEG